MDRLEAVRIERVLPLVHRKLLDIGCGYNNFTALYSGFGVGVDVYLWPGVDILIENSACLPFTSQEFDTVTIIAAFNHIPNRLEALHEVHRVLKDEGRLVLTMIGPLTGWLAHIVFRQDERVRGGMCPGEKKGLSTTEVRSLLKQAQFTVMCEMPFLVLNRVYVATKQKRCRTGWE